MPLYGISITWWDEDKHPGVFQTHVNVADEAAAIVRANALFAASDVLVGGVPKRLQLSRDLVIVGGKAAPVAGIDSERGLKMVFGSTQPTVHPELTLPGILYENATGIVVEAGGKLNDANTDWDAFFDEIFNNDYEDYRGGDLVLLEDNYETFAGKKRKK